MKRAALALAIAVMLGGCGGGNDDTRADGAPSVEEVATYSGDDRQEFLEECAADEGTLVFYTGQNDDLWQPYVAAFGEKYPDIKVDTTRRPSTDTTQAVVQESRAGADKVDVLSLTWSFFAGMQEYFATFDSPELEAYPSDSIYGDSQVVAVDRTPYGLIYNTDKVSEADVPQKPEDLTSDRWKGEFAMSSSTQGVNWIGVIMDLLGEDVLDDLGALNVRAQDVNSAAIASMVAAGEASIAPASPISNTLDLQKQGAPVKWSPVTAFWLDDLVGLAAKANNPCRGMLFIDFLLSKEGQEVNEHSVSARDDVEPSDYLALTEFGGSFDPISLADVVGDEDYSELFATWADLLEQKLIRN